MKLFNHTILLAVLVSWASAKLAESGAVKPRAGKPNVVFILTDDQDKQMDSMDYMQSVKKLLVGEGTTFDRHYCTVALCCPSRVNLLTGRMAHNTNVTDLRLPLGGYNKFVDEHLNHQWIAPWMQQAGYRTYYTGKLMNGHTKKNYNKPFPGGLDGSNFLIGPGTYSYLHPWFQKNKEPPKEYDGYATDLLAEKSYDLIDEGANSGQPFFITIATVAPHANGDDGQDDQSQDTALAGEANAPIPAKRHEKLFLDAKVPRDSGNFNPDRPSGASWVRKLQKQTPENIQYNDLYYRRRLQALQAVDDLVNGTVARLDKHGILENTYIIYSSDNGYHIGQHRLQPGKHCPYEEDINIPLVIRGPNIPKNAKSNIVSSHTDIVPTILGWAGAALPNDLDGKAIPTNGQVDPTQVSEHTQVEHWGTAGFDGKFDKHKKNDTTYKAVRVIGEGYNFYYSVWCNGEHELYDMTNDQAQMNNIYEMTRTTFNIGRQVTLKQLGSRLDTLLLVLKDCKGKACTKPWSALHPGGGVESLKDALKEQYDHFYEQEQKKVGFDKCTYGYLPDLEGPVGFKTYSGMSTREDFI